MAATIIQGVAGLLELATQTSKDIELQDGAAVVTPTGVHLGYSDFMEVTQDRVNTFADATGDYQWIHVDPERAKQESPFGGPIAHGYLTLSLGPVLAPEVFQVEGVTMAVNYGADKVRFPSPVPVGDKVRLGVQLNKVEILGQNDPSTYGAQVSMTFTFECEGAPKPSCVAEIIFRYYE